MKMSATHKRVNRSNKA